MIQLPPIPNDQMIPLVRMPIARFDEVAAKKKKSDARIEGLT